MLYSGFAEFSSPGELGKSFGGGIEGLGFFAHREAGEILP
jgi:hypothetical protein